MTKAEFKEIFDQNFDPIRGYVFYRCGDEDLAVDIAQECFLKLWEKKDKIRLSQVRGLLFKMASDLFINNFHHQKRTKLLFQNISFEEQDYSPEEILSFEKCGGAFSTEAWQPTSRSKTSKNLCGARRTTADNRSVSAKPFIRVTQYFLKA